MTNEELARLRAAFSKVTFSAAEATEAIQDFGRKLAKGQVAEMLKRQQAAAICRHRRRRRARR